MVSPLLISVISQGPPALCTQQPPTSLPVNEKTRWIKQSRAQLNWSGVTNELRWRSYVNKNNYLKASLVIFRCSIHWCTAVLTLWLHASAPEYPARSTVAPPAAPLYTHQQSTGHRDEFDTWTVFVLLTVFFFILHINDSTHLSHASAWNMYVLNKTMACIVNSVLASN